MAWRLSWLTVFLLGACSPLQAASPLPVRQTIAIAITPALRPLSPALQACAANQPEVILAVIETPAGSLMQTDADIYFRLGEPQQLPPFAAPLAWEEIVVITHPTADVGALNPTQLQALFSGSSGGDMQVWVALEGDETRQAFESAILPNGLLTPFAKLAPDPTAMLAAVAADPDAIGYLPNAWVTDDIITIELGLRLPVLALADEELQGPTLNLVSCLQSEIGLAVILESYSVWTE